MLDKYVCQSVDDFIILFLAINYGSRVPLLELSERRKSHGHAKEDDAHSENGCEGIVAVEQVGFFQHALEGLEVVRPLTAGEMELGRVGGKEVVGMTNHVRWGGACRR